VTGIQPEPTLGTLRRRRRPDLAVSPDVDDVDVRRIAC